MAPCDFGNKDCTCKECRGLIEAMEKNNKEKKELAIKKKIKYNKVYYDNLRAAKRKVEVETLIEKLAGLDFLHVLQSLDSEQKTRLIAALDKK